MASDNRSRILETISISAQALDDDTLSQRSGVTPRQTVNQICRGLQAEGMLRRFAGPDGKIVNELAALDASSLSDPSPTTPAISGDNLVAADLPAGSSHEQRAAEVVMLKLLGKRLGCTLAPARLTVPSGARVEVDGADEARTVLVECWAHQGKPRPAQRHKVLSDAFKLAWFALTIYPRPRLVLCLSDPAAAAPFVPPARTWAAQALTDLRISVEVVELPEDIRASVSSAQVRQFR